jgi:hypothetical protein
VGVIVVVVIVVVWGYDGMDVQVWFKSIFF